MTDWRFGHILGWMGWMGVSSALAAEPGRRNGPPAALPAAKATVAPMTDIHDIKPALALGHDLRWLYWALAGVAVLAWAETFNASEAAF